MEEAPPLERITSTISAGSATRHFCPSCGVLLMFPGGISRRVCLTCNASLSLVAGRVVEHFGSEQPEELVKAGPKPKISTQIKKHLQCGFVDVEDEGEFAKDWQRRLPVTVMVSGAVVILSFNVATMTTLLGEFPSSSGQQWSDLQEGDVRRLFLIPTFGMSVLGFALIALGALARKRLLRSLRYLEYAAILIHTLIFALAPLSNPRRFSYALGKNVESWAFSHAQAEPALVLGLSTGISVLCSCHYRVVVLWLPVAAGFFSYVAYTEICEAMPNGEPHNRASEFLLLLFAAVSLAGAWVRESSARRRWLWLARNGMLQDDAVVRKAPVRTIAAALNVLCEAVLAVDGTLKIIWAEGTVVPFFGQNVCGLGFLSLVKQEQEINVKSLFRRAAQSNSMVQIMTLHVPLAGSKSMKLEVFVVCMPKGDRENNERESPWKFLIGCRRSCDSRVDVEEQHKIDATPQSHSDDKVRPASVAATWDIAKTSEEEEPSDLQQIVPVLRHPSSESDYIEDEPVASVIAAFEPYKIRAQQAGETVCDIEADHRVCDIDGRLVGFDHQAAEIEPEIEPWVDDAPRPVYLKSASTTSLLIVETQEDRLPRKSWGQERAITGDVSVPIEVFFMGEDPLVIDHLRNNVIQCGLRMRRYGIRPGDRITHINSMAVHNAEDLQSLVADLYESAFGRGEEQTAVVALGFTRVQEWDCHADQALSDVFSHDQISWRSMSDRAAANGMGLPSKALHDVKAREFWRSARLEKSSSGLGNEVQEEKMMELLSNKLSTRRVSRSSSGIGTDSDHIGGANTPPKWERDDIDE